MYTLSWKKYHLTSGGCAYRNTHNLCWEKNNKACHSERASWLVVVPVTDSSPKSDTDGSQITAFEFVAAAQCHRGEQRQMQLHKMLSKISSPMLGCTVQPCPGVVQKTI